MTVTKKEAEEMAVKLHMKYMETSALAQDGLKVCFDESVSITDLLS